MIYFSFKLSNYMLVSFGCVRGREDKSEIIGEIKKEKRWFKIDGWTDAISCSRESADRPFHKFRTSRSEDRRILYPNAYDVFWSSKIVEGPVG